MYTRLFKKAMKSISWLGLMAVLVSCNLPAQYAGEQAQDVAAPTLTAYAIDMLVMTQLAPTPTSTIPVSLETTAPAVTAGVPFSTATTGVSATATFTKNPEIDYCTDKATFVDDVTVKDGSIFSPGDSFNKIWRLRNVGSCIWTPQYKLTFVGGDKMGAPDEMVFTEYIDPDTTVDISVNMIAPALEGSYQGQWMIRSADGQLFGIGTEADKPFWVKIKVGQVGSDLDLGTPTWLDSFDDSKNWYLLSTANTKFSIKNNRLLMEAFNPGEAEEWGLATKSGIKDFYMEATFKTGDSCSSKDRYGVLVRAPDPNAGYVYGFSCDGRFRFYKWDGNNYQAIEEWKSAGEIVSGPNQVNRLGIRASGSSFILYANGKVIGEYSDATYGSGRFGLFIGSAATPNLQIYVEEIAYWLLGP